MNDIAVFFLSLGIGSWWWWIPKIRAWFEKTQEWEMSPAWKAEREELIKLRNANIRLAHLAEELRIKNNSLNQMVNPGGYADGGKTADEIYSLRWDIQWGRRK